MGHCKANLKLLDGTSGEYIYRAYQAYLRVACLCLGRKVNYHKVVASIDFWALTMKQSRFEALAGVVFYVAFLINCTTSQLV